MKSKTVSVRPTYQRFYSYGFLKLYRDGQQIASTAMPGNDGVLYLDRIEREDREAINKATNHMKEGAK